MLKKILCVLLSVLMVVSLLPMGAFAVDASDGSVVIDGTTYGVIFSEDCSLEASSWGTITLSDTASFVSALQTEGALVLITRSNEVSSYTFESFVFVDSWWNASAAYASTGKYTRTDDEGGVAITYAFDTGTVVAYNASDISSVFSVLTDDYISWGDSAQIITNTDASYTVTNISVVVEEDSGDEEDSGSHSVSVLWIDATLDYSSAEAGTVVTVTPGEGLGIYALGFYTYEDDVLTYKGDVEYTISDDNSSATFVMPDYDVLVSGEIVKESVHELEYTLFAEYDWTIAQEDLEAYDGEDTEAKLITWVNSVMNTWDIDESLTWEVSIYYLSEPVAEDKENNVEAVDGTVGIRITLPDEDYAFGRTGTIVATTSSSSTEEVLAANQELIATLSELLETDEVMYIDQLGSNDDYGWYDYFLTVYYGEVHPNWDEIVASWISSLGDEANIGLAATVYQAPVAGTEDDPDGTDGLLTISYIADVGSEEDGTYVESEYFFVDVVIKATPKYEYDGFIIVNNYGDISYIYNVDFTDSDTYLEISYELNDYDYGWSCPCGFASANDWADTLQVMPCYDDCGGTYTISLTDLATLFADAGYDVNDGVVIDWWVEYDGNEYATLLNVQLVTVEPSTEHDWNDGVITTAPTCTTAGVKTYTCTTCGETYTESVPATGHTAGTVVIENYVKVTADADGSYDTVTYCTVCGEEISRSHTVIAAYGTGSAEVIDWATVLANANSSNATTTTTVEDVVIEEPIEPTDTETEDDDEEEPAAEPAVEAEAPAETNPTTGVAISLIPMAIAALAAVSSKRK